MSKINPRPLNFDQTSNGQVCSCGRHHGVGQWAPEQRAENYSKMRSRLPDLYRTRAHMSDYLRSWEHYHGGAKSSHSANAPRDWMREYEMEQESA